MKKKIIVFFLMISSVVIQAMEHDSAFKLKAALAVVGIAATGVTIWRMTAPSDEQVTQNIDDEMVGQDLHKYNQDFDVVSHEGEQENQLTTNLITKLLYKDQYQKTEDVQSQLRDDSYQLKNLKNSIWFRSFFNTDVSQQYHRIKKSQVNADILQSYFQKHDNFFKGWNLSKEHKDFIVNANLEKDWIIYIHKVYLGKQKYPLLYFENKCEKNIDWINSLPQGIYPKLKADLKTVCDGESGIAVWLLRHSEFLSEKEEKRKQDLVDIEAMNVQTLLLQAQAAVKNADVAKENLHIERKRLELEKQQNERERIQARVASLRRSGYSDRQIQNQLNNEGFTKVLMSVIFS